MTILKHILIWHASKLIIIETKYNFNTSTVLVPSELKQWVVITVVEQVHIQPSAINKLQSIVSEANLSTSLSVREHHGHDESYHE